MKTYTLTDKEFKAAGILVTSCLDGMGGKRPSDLEHDEYTWISIKDLMDKGYSRHEAAGLFSSLDEKGFIFDNDPTEKTADHWMVQTSAWRWFDSQWDAYQAAQKVAA